MDLAAGWPHFIWGQAAIAPAPARARLAQGKVLGAARLLDSSLTMEAVAAILDEDGLTTSASRVAGAANPVCHD